VKKRAGRREEDRGGWEERRKGVSLGVLRASLRLALALMLSSKHTD